MSREKIGISEAELEIMKVLWSTNNPMNTQAITKALSRKSWKRTTISTLLARLTDKGAISKQKQTNVYLYTPVISEKEYRRQQTRNLIKNLYHGSVREFAVSLFEDDTMSEDEIAQLKALFDS